MDPFLSGKDDPATIVSVGDDPDAILPLVARFTAAECAVLAGRIFEITGWPIVALEDLSGERFLPVHYLNRRSDGRLVDAHGVWLRKSLCSSKAPRSEAPVYRSARERRFELRSE
jgi:hypothetical protein